MSIVSRKLASQNFQKIPFIMRLSYTCLFYFSIQMIIFLITKLKQFKKCSAFEPPTTQTSSVPTRPTGEQLASLPDDYKVFTNEIINDIAYPSSSTKIYKEECIWCCDTVYSKNGLFISLKSFHAYGERIKNQAPTQSWIYIYSHHSI